MQCRQCHIETPTHAIAQRSTNVDGDLVDVLCVSCWESMTAVQLPEHMDPPTVLEPEPPNQAGALEWAKYREWQRQRGEANEQLEMWRMIADHSN